MNPFRLANHLLMNADGDESDDAVWLNRGRQRD